MNKQQLLEFITSLPDDLTITPIDLSECKSEAGDWKSQNKVTSLGGVYQQRVDNTLVLRLEFTARYEGEFRRTLENQDGVFHNVHRVN